MLQLQYLGHIFHNIAYHLDIPMKKSIACNMHKEVCQGVLLGNYFITGWLSLPWWHNGKESACQCRRRGFDPWSRKIPHAAGQLSQRRATTEPTNREDY